MEKFLENNSEQEDVCIAVYGKEQYDEFMELLHNNGYYWYSQVPMKLEDITHTTDDAPFLMLVYLNTEEKSLSQVHLF